MGYKLLGGGGGAWEYNGTNDSFQNLSTMFTLRPIETRMMLFIVELNYVFFITGLKCSHAIHVY